ncbi:MAG: helix-turn-helix transcriptional regulator [Phycisphaerae bacterium]|nr:helix-turn-helix transcriptional regulator [Phycisphaerae bacterium]
MARTLSKRVRYEVVELEGVRYAILPESLLRDICRRAGLELRPPAEKAGMSNDLGEMGQLDAQDLAERLIARRKRAGLSQAQLARLAGIRVETLNRIERGRVTPDFATIRKLVTAIKTAEGNERD